ncbi:MAG: MFS transporter [Woeseiaceae bacterium]|jgi:MFS family permease|nr:MFS transporter [Woeseiaceae bacterium]
MTTDSDNAIAVMLPGEKRAVGVVTGIAMLRMFGLFSLLPVLSLYAAQLVDATPLLVGLAVGAYGLTQAGLQIPFGALSDRIGRVPVIVGGLIIFAVGSIVAAMGDTIWGVIIGRLLQGAGAISATLTALIADATREEVRTRSMAIVGVIGFGMAFVIAFIAGPVIAGQFGVPSLFWLAAGLAVVAGLLLKGLPDSIERPEVRQSWNILPAFRPDLLRLDLYVFLLHAILTATFVALPFLLVNRLGMPVTDFWQMYIGALGVSLFGAIPLILSDERQGKTRIIAIAVTLLLAGELMLAFGSFGTVPVFIALAVFFAGFTFLEAGLPARLSLLADGEVRGASLGVFSSAQFFGAFVGGLIGGRFLASGRPSDVFFVCALLAAIWLASSSLFSRQS